ncbi:DUF3515 domain-containing protein [Streptomyces sp. TR06-5]|uniref:DUF3515 domain-containing protein n=1 Tax=Streptomyces sp. TR06-5 TaxID=3385976 RepID=UPI0039A14E5E
MCLVLAGCGAITGAGAGPVPPDPSGRAAVACRALHRALPERVTGLDPVDTRPASRYTAAWGDPSVELRCGVSRPDVLRPGSEHYNPTAEAVDVNGVSWLLEQRENGYRFTTTDRAARVEVTVPDAYAPEVGVLTAFADPIERTVPPQHG